MRPVVAIDGPAGSGKGTLARMIASHFSFIYLDTGLLYRTVAFLNVPLTKLKGMNIKEILNTAAKLTDEQLRSSENSARASDIAKMPEIRDIMTRLQRDFIDLYKKQGTVLDGRDIGTVVVPDACCKLFITADLKERAKRRFADLMELRNKGGTTELKNKSGTTESRNKSGTTESGNKSGTTKLRNKSGTTESGNKSGTTESRNKSGTFEDDTTEADTTFDEVFNNMKLRDAQDKSRKIAPLTCDETYIMVDTTGQSVQESFKICREEVEKAFMNSEFRSFV